jgi:hypothetical protein
MRLVVWLRKDELNGPTDAFGVFSHEQRALFGLDGLGDP